MQKVAADLELHFLQWSIQKTTTPKELIKLHTQMVCNSEKIHVGSKLIQRLYNDTKTITMPWLIT